MDPPRDNDLKARITLCLSCENQLTNVVGAMRHHESQMLRFLELAKKPDLDLSKEERLAIKARLTASFNEAQDAWNAYRERLIQHGVIPAE